MDKINRVKCCSDLDPTSTVETNFQQGIAWTCLEKTFGY